MKKNVNRNVKLNLKEIVFMTNFRDSVVKSMNLVRKT